MRAASSLPFSCRRASRAALRSAAAEAPELLGELLLLDAGKVLPAGGHVGDEVALAGHRRPRPLPDLLI